MVPFKECSLKILVIRERYQVSERYQVTKIDVACKNAKQAFPSNLLRCLAFNSDIRFEVLVFQVTISVKLWRIFKMSDISTEDLTFLVHDIARWILLLVSWSLAAALSK